MRPSDTLSTRYSVRYYQVAFSVLQSGCGGLILGETPYSYPLDSLLIHAAPKPPNPPPMTSMSASMNPVSPRGRELIARQIQATRRKAAMGKEKAQFDCLIECAARYFPTPACLMFPPSSGSYLTKYVRYRTDHARFQIYAEIFERRKQS